MMVILIKLQHLREAATSGFDSLRATCETVKTVIDSQYPVTCIPCGADACQLQCLLQHQFSQELLPDEFRLMQAYPPPNCGRWQSPTQVCISYTCGFSVGIGG